MTRSLRRTAAAALPLLLSLQVVLAEEGFVIYGVGQFARVGLPVGSAGDINHDGRPDLFTCANTGNRCFVVYGADTPPSDPFVLDDLLPPNNDGSIGFVVLPREADDGIGKDGGFVGDVNGDGIDDLLVSGSFASFDGIEPGEAYVIFGTEGNLPAVFDVANLLPPTGDGSAGFIIRGIDDLDRMSTRSAPAGDVNGDGFDDIILGATQADVNDVNTTGEAYVVYGRAQFPSTLLLSDLLAANGGDGSEGFILEGIDRNDQVGFEVARLGDINGDGLDDIAVSASSVDLPGAKNTGVVYVVYGRTTGFPPQFPLRDLTIAGGGDGSEGFVIPGIAAFDDLGTGLNGIDINGDGRKDLIMGNPGGTLGTGQAIVIYGQDGIYPTEFDITELFASNGGDGSVGIVINGIGVGDGTTGSVAEVGDMNGDGIDDVLFSASGRDFPGRLGNGAAILLYGRPDFPAEVELSALLPANGGDGSAGSLFEGVDSVDRAGIGVGGLGDFNGDGRVDIAIGADEADPLGVDNAGEVYVLYGRAGGFPPRFQLGTLLPFSLAASGNCPGQIDLAVEGATPGRPLWVFTSRTLGSGEVPNGPCAGTMTRLGNPALRQMAVAETNGKVIVQGQVGAGSCGAFAQAVDLATCEVSALTRLPSAAAAGEGG